MYRYYLAVIFGAPSLLALIGWLAGDIPLHLSFIASYGATATAFAVGAITAILIRAAIPAAFFDPLSRRFRVRKWERRFYVRIGIRHWKDRIPETGALLGYLSKRQIADRKDNAYLMHFMTETCYAETMHLACVLTGFLILIPGAFVESAYLVCLILPVAIIHGILHFLPVLVQRYIRPFLLHAYLHNKAKEKTNIGGQTPTYTHAP